MDSYWILDIRLFAESHNSSQARVSQARISQTRISQAKVTGNVGALGILGHFGAKCADVRVLPTNHDGTCHQNRLEELLIGANSTNHISFPHGVVCRITPSIHATP